MIRVLHSVSNMDRAGIETMLMNYYRHIDKSRVQFDFLVNKPKKGDYDDEIRQMGGHIYLSPGLNPINYPKYLRFTDDIIKGDPDIRILHAHNEAMGLYALSGAKKAGIEKRIAHAHNTRIIRDYKYPLKIFCKQFLACCATDLWACGRDAGIYFFGAKRWKSGGMIMRNAIQTEKFLFSEENRLKIKKEFSLEDKLVIGHVGRFNVQKNHMRLLEIFSEVKKLKPEAVLFLIGEGELEDTSRRRASELGIADSVIFAGLKENVEELYSAMDAFVMPSLFEGLPVVGIEAQASGLPCIFSDAVTDEVVLTENAIRLPLKADNRLWAKETVRLAEMNNQRSKGALCVANAGYDIKKEAKRIEELYIKMAE